MLTKDLLNFRVVKANVHPQLQPLDDTASLEVSQQIIDINTRNLGVPLATLSEEVHSEVCFAKPKFITALEKLFHDRCTFAEPDPSILETRWNLIQAAERLRIERGEKLTQDEFVEDLSVQFAYQTTEPDEANSATRLRERLYADLPEKALLKTVPDFAPLHLINLYNIAQIQGLLMNAHDVRISLKLPEIQDRRLFVTTLKFHQLLWSFDDKAKNDDKHFSVEISGPLQVFSQNLKYGRSLARFFPTLLWFKVTSLEATVVLDKKKLNLSLTDKHFKLLEATTSKPSRYQPDWLTDLFADLQTDPIFEWSIEECCEHIHLSNKSACFPDIVCRHKQSKQVLFIEIFHRWHKSQFQSRQEALKNEKGCRVVLLAQKSLGGKKLSANAASGIVFFGEMITSKKMRECLAVGVR